MVHQLCIVTSSVPTRESGQLSLNGLSPSPALNQSTKAWEAKREMLLFISSDRLFFFYFDYVSFEKIEVDFRY